MPLHINDDDICPSTLRTDDLGEVTERPWSEFTRLSYTVHALEIAIIARESIDLREAISLAQPFEGVNEAAKMRNQLDQKYETFLAKLPSYFRFGSTVALNGTGPDAAIPVHRWKLHQQLWGVYLRLHRANLSSQTGRASCQLLAQNIISTTAQIQTRCAVRASLSISETQLFNAAMVLIIDLLLSSMPNDAHRSSARLTRMMTRDKIREAIDLLRTDADVRGSLALHDHQPERGNASSPRNLLVLEGLLKLEEEESNNSEESGASISTTSKQNSLRDKVIDMLHSLPQTFGNPTATADQVKSYTSSALDTSTSPSSTTPFYQELDVLPLLSNEPSSDFWQFIDFALSPSLLP